jgi:two-component system, NarL family, response regulator LiaR
VDSLILENPIRILVADDHPVVRDGLVAILGTQPDFQVVGEAADGHEILQKALLLHPDVALIDLEMPGMDGVEALEHLRRNYPEIKALVFTAFDTDERILGAVKAGALGYLLKGAPREDLFRAIRVVSQGGSLLEPVVASKLLRHVRNADSKPGELSEELTNREREVLNLIAMGRTNQEIANTLVISERTAKFHVSSILRKMGASNRTEAVRLAEGRGLVER